MASPTETPPFLRLPDELVIAITTAGQENHCLPDYSDWESRPKRLEAELTLSHICRRFRDTVSGACILWARVEIDFTRQGSIQLSQLYLQRSATCKIWVIMRTGHYVETQSIAHLVPHIARISRLYIAFKTYRALRALFRPFQDVATPYLEHLRIEDIGGEVPTPIDLPSQIGTQFRSLELKRCALRALPPWTAATTHLKLKSGSCLDSDDEAEIFRSVTTRLPSLTHLYIQLQDDRYTFDSGIGITLKFLTHLHLEFEDSDTPALLSTLARFDTPCLTHFNITGAHGDQIALLFNARQHQRSAGLTFPALTSLAFTHPTECNCDGFESQYARYQSISSPPRQLFPALSSLALINECFTAKLLSDLLGPHSAPWPSLRTVIVHPQEEHTENVYTALQNIVRWKRTRQETLPTFRLSSNLFGREFWEENGVLVELLGADEIIRAFGSVVWAYDG
ncbi:hypothetical protein FB45DRAFT_1003991 [Roridomyces roridus]|uniref:F-box domain-containing protein n=1 Tax=Roridomyces roridus TaxID=1738132 RepID=A0AAD7BQQ3_9AGAR|nr:hypothetical protein FB45DRAFT_1003991 [Roridomyces roridus]